MYVMKRCGGVFIMKRCVLNVLCSHTCSHTFGFVGSLLFSAANISLVLEEFTDIY